MSKKRPFPNRYIFDDIDTEEKAYWLGFLYADGSVSSKENKIELGLCEKDLNHMEKFRNFIGLDNKISYREKTKSYRYCFRDTEFKDILIEKGCIPNKSLKLLFPTEDQVPTYLIRHFIRGYFDGDGYFTNTENSLSLGFIGTYDFLKELIECFPDGVNKKLKIHDVHRENGAKRYLLSGKKDIELLLDYMYVDAKIYLDRKYEHYLKFKKYGYEKYKSNCRLIR